MLSRDPARARERLGSGVAADALGPARRAGARRGARRPRRRRPPRRRAGRAALERRRQGAHPHEPRERHAQPRRRPAQRRAAPGACSCPPPPSATTARAATSGSTEDDPPGDDFLAEVVRRLGARGAGGGASSGCASRSCAPASCSTPTAARSRRCCRRSSSGVGGPVAGGDQYMPWIHVDDLVGLYLAALDDAGWSGPAQRQRARAGHQQRLLEGARPRAAPPGGRAGPARSRCSCSTARWREIVTTGQRAVPQRAARARLRVRAPRARRGAALSARLRRRRGRR